MLWLSILLLFSFAGRADDGLLSFDSGEMAVVSGSLKVKGSLVQISPTDPGVGPNCPEGPGPGNNKNRGQILEIAERQNQQLIIGYSNATKEDIQCVTKAVKKDIGEEEDALIEFDEQNKELRLNLNQLISQSGYIKDNQFTSLPADRISKNYCLYLVEKDRCPTFGCKPEIVLTTTDQAQPTPTDVVVHEKPLELAPPQEAARQYFADMAEQSRTSKTPIVVPISKIPVVAARAYINNAVASVTDQANTAIATGPAGTRSKTHVFKLPKSISTIAVADIPGSTGARSPASLGQSAPVKIIDLSADNKPDAESGADNSQTDSQARSNGVSPGQNIASNRTSPGSSGGGSPSSQGTRINRPAASFNYAADLPPDEIGKFLNGGSPEAQRLILDMTSNNPTVSEAASAWLNNKGVRVNNTKDGKSFGAPRVIGTTVIEMQVSAPASRGPASTEQGDATYYFRVRETK